MPIIKKTKPAPKKQPQIRHSQKKRIVRKTGMLTIRILMDINRYGIKLNWIKRKNVLIVPSAADVKKNVITICTARTPIKGDTMNARKFFIFHSLIYYSFAT